MIGQQNDLIAGLTNLVRRSRKQDVAPPRQSQTDYFIASIEPLVDSVFYFQRYPHVREAGITAAAHYVREGWREGYDPAPWFSSEGYTRINTDVAHGSLPPFVHYVLYGRREGRTIMATAAVRRHDAANAAPPAVASSAIGQDLRALRAREKNDWDSHIAGYTARRLERLAARDAAPQAAAVDAGASPDQAM